MGTVCAEIMNVVVLSSNNAVFESWANIVCFGFIRRVALMTGINPVITC